MRNSIIKRVVLVGLGMMGYNHARVLAHLSGVELVGILDPNGDTRGLFPQIPLVTKVEEALALSPDYCVIAAPTALHENLALKFISEGVHVLIEKPIAVTFESSLRINDEAKKNGVIGAVGHIERFNSALREARKRIAAGELGQIYQVTTRRLGPFPSRISDVGVVMDLATHDIDLTSWLTGNKYECLSAQTATQSGRQHEDLVAVVGMLENGIVVNHTVNWLSPLKERKTIITGERGSFVVDTLTSDLTFYEDGKIDVTTPSLAHFKGVTQGDIHIYAFEKPEPLLIEHRNFLGAVSGNPAEIVTLREGAQTVRVAEAILESSRSRSVITL